MNYKEIQKLYPEIKIPVEQYADYYILQLAKTNANITNILMDYLHFPDCENLGKIKNDFMWNVIHLLETYLPKLSTCDTSHHTLYHTKDFNNFNPDKLYLSIDLKQANYQAFALATGLLEKDWEEFINNNFPNTPALLIKSKSLRQFIFGNLSPKKLQQIQQKIMLVIVEKLGLLQTNIVSYKNDEIILELDMTSNGLIPLEKVMEIKEINFQFQVKINTFQIKLKENFGDTVKMKITDKEELVEVPGNRFFLHYKTLILNEKLEKPDLLFQLDKHIAQWQID